VHVSVEPAKPYQGGPESLTGFTVRVTSETLNVSFPIPLQEAPAIVTGMLGAIRDYQVATAEKLKAAADMGESIRTAADALATPQEAS
jgi:hypothetical protein